MKTKKVKSLRQLRKVAKTYFDRCDREKIPYTMSGLASALHITRHTLTAYKQDEEYGPEVEMYKGIIEAQMEERMLTGQNAATPSIFSLKNNYGWKDKLEVETNTNINIKTIKELSTEKILKLLPSAAITEVEELAATKELPQKTCQ